MSPASIAPGKISLAINRLNSEYPLHAGILAQWRVEESADVGTMGVGFRDGRLRLVYSPEFIESIGMDELMGVLHHEVNHVLFGHVTHTPDKQEDGQARTIAEEVTVNEWVSEPLPGTPVLLEQYPFLPENESTEDRYGKLRKRANLSLGATRAAPSRGVPSCSAPNSANSAGAGSGQSGGSGQTGQKAKAGPGGAVPQGAGSQPGGKAQGAGTHPGGTGQPGGTSRSGKGGKSGNAENGTGPGSQPGGNPRLASQPTSNGVRTTDDHSIWAEVLENKERAERAAKMDIAVTWDSLTPEERDKVEEPFAEIAEAAAEESGFEAEPAFGIGNEAGEEAEALHGGEGHVPWQVVLRRHVGRILERRPVFGRVPRRFPDMAGIVPGKGRFAQKPKVMTVIDTSGSMTVAMLEAISAELGLMARHYDVDVVECDAQIQRVYPYRPIVTVQGRGGTDFRPPFEPSFLREHRPDLVVYFTDGYGPAPEQAPRIPVIWCIAADGAEPAEWGEKITLSEPKFGPDVPNFGPEPGIYWGATNGIGAAGSQD